MTALASIVAAGQHRLASALGVDEDRRAQTVISMLENNRRRAPGYWIQLFLAMGIATLGLVLDSTAVVIGAMLVSPLMGPILELGMGFAVGSPFLVLRASLRVAFSVVVVVACSGLLTMMLPFHEITGEIASRVAPTALDLLVAVFCALTAAYTTVRATSDTTSAAAGTAIGIALVPPLCTCGFGIGIGSAAIAGGAALLFTANFSAILLFAVTSFLLLGYNQVDAQRLGEAFSDTEETRTGRLAGRAETSLQRAFGSRYGLAMRVLIPAVFLAAVFVPLRTALTEVTWEVRTRDAIRAIVNTEAPHAVQTVVQVERHTIALRLVVVGGMERVASLEHTLREHIAARSGVVPTVVVTAVADIRTLAAASARRTVDLVEAPLDVGGIRQRVEDALQQYWPTASAGALTEWAVSLAMAGPPEIVVRHVGPPLGGPGTALLAQSLGATLATSVRVTDAPLAADTVSAAQDDARAWWRASAPILEWVADARAVVACVSAPIGPSRRLTNAQRATLVALHGSRAAASNRLSLTDSSRWTIRVASGTCAGTGASAPGGE